MTKAKLAQINEFKKNIERAYEIRYAFWCNCIDIKAPERDSVNSIWLDKQTRDEWTKINREFFDRRIKELEEEFERM